MAPTTDEIVGKLDQTSVVVEDFELYVEAKRRDNGCGIGRFHPSWMQKCADIKFFTINNAIMILATFCFSTYVVSQITTLEKQFQLSSTESALFLSCNEIGFVTSSIILTHFARRAHIPRILAILGLLLAVAGFFNSIPHFVMLPQKFLFFVSGDSSSHPIASERRCYVGSHHATANVTLSCVKAEHKEFMYIRKVALSIICCGMVLTGSVKGPRGGLSIGYIDDNVEKSKYGYHLGVVMGLGILGPCLAFGVGAFFNTQYVTLTATQLSPKDPRWIGAWWLGFIVFGCFAALVSIPMLCFPKSLKAYEESENFKDLLRDLPRAVCRLFRNKLYVLLKLAIAATSLMVSGSILFYPKYIELQFKTLPWLANTVFGSSMVSAAAIGSFASGMIASRLKLGVRGCAILIVSTLSVSLVFTASLTFLRCEPIVYHGHTVYGRQSYKSTECTKNCSCADTDFLPVCGSDDKTYFSPCHAGCALAGNKTFKKCNCVSGGNGTATPRLCEPVCRTVIPYTIVSFVGGFIRTIHIVPTIIINMRVVEERDKKFSIGLGNLITTLAVNITMSHDVCHTMMLGVLVGWLLGPIVFGHVIDTTCLLWGSKCGVRGACNIYDIDLLRYKFHGLILGAEFVSLLFYVAILVIILRSRRYKNATPAQNNPETDDERAPTVYNECLEDTTPI